MRYFMIDRHHLLECILWPNEDGTFRKIINTQKRLEELGIYNDYKLTIPIEHGVHNSMHIQFKKGTEYELCGEKHPCYGRTGVKHPMYGRTGNAAPMYGKGYLISGDKNANWKGDKATDSGMYKRAKKLYKAGKITEEEFQPFRDSWKEYKRRIKNRKKTTLP